MRIHYTLLSIFLLIFFCFETGYTQGWTIISVGVGTKPAIEVDSNSVPHIAYMLEAQPGFIKHAELENDVFESTTIQEAYYYGPLDIAISPANQPGISVHHHDLQDEVNFFRSTEGAWTAESVVSTGHDGWDNSITFDSNGFPHTSSVDPSRGVEYAWKDATGWHKEEIGSVPVSYMFSTSIALDENDAPHIAFYASDQTYYGKKVLGSWIIEKVETENGKFPTLLLDSDGFPHLAYYVQVSGNQGIIRYANKISGSWQFQNIGGLLNVPIEFSGARRVTALQMDSDETIHACYGDRDVVKYAVLNEGIWSIATVVDVTADLTILGAQVDMALSKNDLPHITYFEVTNLNPLTGLIKYATLFDNDEDGYTTLDDCNDNDPDVNPGAQEIVDNGIDDNCDGVLETTTSVYELDGSRLSVFPNPVSSILNIELPTAGSFEISIRTLSGQIIYNESNKFGNVDIDISVNPNGIYLLGIRSLVTQTVISERIVIQK